MSQFIEINIPAPWKQAALAFVLALPMMLFGRTMPQGAPLFAWMSSGALLLLFSLFNNGLSIFSDRFMVYAQQSLLSFLVLLVALGLSAWLISGKSIDEAPPYRSIYMVLLLAHVSLVSLCFLIRSIAVFLRDKDERMHRR